MEFDRKRVEEPADIHGISGIATSLPKAEEDAANVRNGATADMVLRFYLDRYKIKHTFWLMKSGMGVDEKYACTPRPARMRPSSSWLRRP